MKASLIPKAAIIKHPRTLNVALSGIVLLPGILAGLVMPLVQAKEILQFSDFKIGVAALLIAAVIILFNKRTAISCKCITISYNWWFLPLYHSRQTFAGATHLCLSRRVIQSQKSSTVVFPLHLHSDNGESHLITESKQFVNTRRHSELIAKYLRVDVHYDLPDNQRIRAYAELDAPLADTSKEEELQLTLPQKSNITIEPALHGVKLRVGMHGGWPMFIIVGVLELVAIIVWYSSGLSEGPLFFRIWTLIIITMVFNVGLIKMAFAWWPRCLIADKSGLRVGRHFFPSDELEEINIGSSPFGSNLLEFTSDRRLLRRFSGHEDADLDFIRSAAIHGLRGGKL